MHSKYSCLQQHIELCRCIVGSEYTQIHNIEKLDCHLYHIEEYIVLLKYIINQVLLKNSLLYQMKIYSSLL